MNYRQTFSTTLGIFVLFWFRLPILIIFGLFFIWFAATSLYDQVFGISCEKAATVLGEKARGLSGGYLSELTQADINNCRGDVSDRNTAQNFLNLIKIQTKVEYLQASGQWCALGYKQMLAGSDRCILDCPEGSIEEPGISGYCLKCGSGLRNCKRVLPNGKDKESSHQADSSN